MITDLSSVVRRKSVKLLYELVHERRRGRTSMRSTAGAIGISRHLTGGAGAALDCPATQESLLGGLGSSRRLRIIGEVFLSMNHNGFHTSIMNRGQSYFRVTFAVEEAVAAMSIRHSRKLNRTSGVRLGLFCGVLALLGPTILLECSGAAAADLGANVPDQVEGNSRGYLTTPQELRQIKARAKQGLEPYNSAYHDVVRYANRTWDWPVLSRPVTCPTADEPAYVRKGSVLVYAKALAYHLTGDEQYALGAKAAIEGLLGIASFGKPGNSKKPDRQCQLNLSWSIPGFIRAADLLEDYQAWKQRGTKERFQNWLAEVVYPTISFTAEVAVSNWGAAATNCSAYIADYLWDRGDLLLISYNGLDSTEPTTARRSAEAYEHAIQLALNRMNGIGAVGRGGSAKACDFSSATKSMIRPDGGIPDELRRGSTGCSGPRILENDKSNMYSQTHLQNVIAQAELLLRRGDRRIYDNIRTDSLLITYKDPKAAQHPALLPPGRGSLKQAILFVLDAPSFQEPRSLKSAAEVAYRYYRHPAMLKAVLSTRPNSNDRAMSFETLTHGFAEGENPNAPPIVPPRQ